MSTQAARNTQLATRTAPRVAPRTVSPPARAEVDVTALYRRLSGGYAHALCRRWTRRHVSDAEVDDWLSYLGPFLPARLAAFDGRGALDGFLYRVLYRLFCDWCRERGRARRDREAAREACSGAYAPDELAAVDLRRTVRTLMKRLPLEQRLAVLLPELAEHVQPEDVDTWAKRRGCTWSQLGREVREAVRGPDTDLALAKLVYVSPGVSVGEGEHAELVNRFQQARSRGRKALEEGLEGFSARRKGSSRESR